MKHNFVAKHASKYHKMRVFKDRKKAIKRGCVKHKKVLQTLEREQLVA